MKQITKVTVKTGKVEGRVTLKLENADGVFQAWLSPEQAERLAADIFACRFDLPFPIVNRPPQWKKPPKEVFISFRTTMPRKLEPRPSAHFIKDIKDPARRKDFEKYLPSIEAAGVKWVKRLAKRVAKKEPGFFTGATPPKR